MKGRLFILFICLLGAGCLSAETRITLRSGETITGTVVFQNEDVIVIKNVKGNRFQYPMAEVTKVEEEVAETVVADTKKTKAKKVGGILQVNGGAMCDTALPSDRWGGVLGGHLLIGANDLLQKKIFLGGGIGYQALILHDAVYSILPIQVHTIVPLLHGKHAPFLGLGVGYGISLNKDTEGGLFASADFGWRVQTGTHSALLLSLHANFQQLLSEWEDTIDNKIFINETTHTLCGLSLQVALQF